MKYQRSNKGSVARELESWATKLSIPGVSGEKSREKRRVYQTLVEVNRCFNGEWNIDTGVHATINSSILNHGTLIIWGNKLIIKRAYYPYPFFLFFSFSVQGWGGDRPQPKGLGAHSQLCAQIKVVLVIEQGWAVCKASTLTLVLSFQPH